MNPLYFLLNIIRGALIGMAELVPGISGGTVALVVGIYERAIHAANALIYLAKTIVTNRSQTRAAAQRVDWGLLLSVGIGMLCAVFFLSSLLHNVVTNHPENSRGMFFGMVLVSIIVPLSMIDPSSARRRPVGIAAIFIIAAGLAFFITSFTAVPQENPSLIVVFCAAAVAVCALVLPGVSGSLLLLSFGLYNAIIGAVSERNVPIMIVFALGALCGLLLFVRLLDHLLSNHRAHTLSAIAGLMVGSLRALWPWQSPQGELLFGGAAGFFPILSMVVGAILVIGIILIEKYISSKPQAAHPN